MRAFKRGLGLLLCVIVLLAGCAKPSTPRLVATSTSDRASGSAVEASGPSVPTASAPTTASSHRGAASQPNADRPRTAVRFILHDIQVPQYERLIEAFEADNPDLRIEIVSLNEVLGLGAVGSTDVPDDAEQRMAAAADVVTFSPTRENVAKGLLRDISPLVETDASFDADDYLPDTLAAMSWQGATWALPTSVNYRLIYYNKDACDEVGLAYPTAGWSWDDLAAAAEQLTRREGGEVSRWGLVWPPSLAYRLVESHAGGLVDYDREPPMAQYDDEAAAEALGWVTSLHLDAEAMPYGGRPAESDGPNLTQEQKLIDEGHAAMWPDHALLWTYRKMQGNVGVVPFPVEGENNRTTPGWVSGVAMSAGTAHPEAAWRWMRYLSEQPPTALGQQVPPTPARRSVIEASGYWAKLDDELAAALKDAVDHGYVAREPVAHDAFTEAYHTVMSKEETVAQALTDLQAEAIRRQQAADLAGATPAPTFAVQRSEEKPVDANAVTIQFVPGLGALNLEPYRKLAARFHEENPDVVVDLRMFDLAAGGAPTLASMAATADCFQWYPNLQDPTQRGAVLSLEPFLDADDSIALGDYYPQLLSSFTAQEQLWGLPADVTPFVIEYNRDLFDAAGLDYPAADWTWDDFLELAVALTDDSGAETTYGYVAEVYESSDMMLMLERLGAQLLDSSGEQPAITFDDPSVVEAMTWYASLTLDYEVKTTYITDLTKLAGASSFYLEREGLINGGKAAMWTNSGTSAMLFGPRKDVNVGVLPLPARADGKSRTSLLTTSGYFVSAETPYREACWRWLTYLSEQPDAVLGFPARRAVAESGAYRKLAGEERADAYLASVADGANPSSLQVVSEEDWLSVPLFWLYQAYGKVVRGEMDAASALAEAQDMAERYTECVVSGGDYTRDGWYPCVKGTDPSLPDYLFAQAQ